MKLECREIQYFIYFVVEKISLFQETIIIYIRNIFEICWVKN